LKLEKIVQLELELKEESFKFVILTLSLLKFMNQSQTLLSINIFRIAVQKQVMSDFFLANQS